MRPLIDRVAAYRRAEHNGRPLFWSVQSIELDTRNKESQEKRNSKKGVDHPSKCTPFGEGGQ